MEPRIIHYDFAEFRYASFFWVGFEENARRHGYRFEISKRVPPIIETIGAEWRELLASVCLFKIITSTREAYFCIDGRDSSKSAAGAGRGYHLPLLEAVDCYFKVNLNRQHLEADPCVKRHLDKILPVLPFFPIRPDRLRPYLPRLSPSRSANWTLYDSARRGKQLLTMPSLHEIRQLRERKKKRDVFFVMKCYAHPIHQADNEFRYRLAKELQACRQIDSFVGLTGTNLTGKFREFAVEEYALRDYLGHLAESRVAIYVRGLFDCLSFKLGQFLALGMPIVGQGLANNTENIMTSKLFPQQFRFEDPQSIVRRIVTLLNHPDELEALSQSNLQQFETKFTPEAVVGNLLPPILLRL